MLDRKLRLVVCFRAGYMGGVFFFRKLCCCYVLFTVAFLFLPLLAELVFHDFVLPRGSYFSLMFKDMYRDTT